MTKKKTIKLRKDEETEECYFTIRQLLYGTGVPASKVDSYEINELDDDTGFILTLYDKDGKIVKI